MIFIDEMQELDEEAARESLAKPARQMGQFYSEDVLDAHC